MTLPGAETMKAGINGLESFRLVLGRLSGCSDVPSKLSARDSVELRGMMLVVWPFVNLAVFPFVYASGATIEGIGLIGAGGMVAKMALSATTLALVVVVMGYFQFQGVMDGKACA